ncbi:hypothetical protein IEQ34_001734 [Dendrobium chrysotoxum]|uniref:Uncharacterized protein n=1 Tax=Dendrobium chrysotoxum TaxID=161865 RepID=A0AAV7HM18_DENCH|nr:hypothetical protein IEQ34_001734 [Dendrobium chrysotoxum]
MSVNLDHSTLNLRTNALLLRNKGKAVEASELIRNGGGEKSGQIGAAAAMGRTLAEIGDGEVEIIERGV